MTFISSIYKNTNVKVTTHSSAQTLSSTANTFLTISGSEITYVPDLTSSKVIYEISFYAEAVNIEAFGNFYLERYDDSSSSWVEISSNFRKNVGYYGSGQTLRSLLSYRYVLPTWTGPRQIRLRCAPHRTNNPMTFHQMTYWDGSSSITDKFCNTTLVVYSD
tara:strand:- start:418 stop:903 length:486 start_codon:yes stop_codon:yes gene_type:complete